MATKSLDFHPVNLDAPGAQPQADASWGRCPGQSTPSVPEIASPKLPRSAFRELAELRDLGLLKSTGAGRSVRYDVAWEG